MRLNRGRGLTHDYRYFPIFELDTQYLPTITQMTSRGFTISKFNTTSNLLNLLPANMPRRRIDSGNIIQTEGLYTYDSELNRYVIPEMQNVLESVQMGVKPEDFDINPQDYYTLGTVTPSEGNATLYKSITAVADDEIVWSNTVTYYHYTGTPAANITQYFTTGTGCTFGCNYNIRSSSDLQRMSARIFNNPYDGLGTYAYAKARNVQRQRVTDNSYQVELTKVGTLSITAPFYWVMIFVSFNNNYGIALVQMSDGTENALPQAIYFSGIDETFWGDSIQQGNVPGIGTWGDDSTTGGGNGTFTAVSNNRGDTSGTGVATLANNAGTLINAKAAATFLNIYHVSTADMVELTSVLFSADYFDKFRQSMYNPLSAVLSCHLLPMGFIPVTPLSQRHYTAGGYDLSGDMTIPTTNGDIIGSIQAMHVGSIDISAYFDAYPDYAPYTKCTLHLPYIGAVDIDINSIVGGKLAVDYICDVISGNVAAWVYCQDESGTHTYKYVGTGNCAYNIPLIAENQSGVAVGKSLMSAVAGAASLAAGNVGGISGIASGVVGGLTASHTAQISGNLSGNMGAICDPTCWLEIERPIWVNPSTYKQLHGIPSQIGGTIAENECTGFLAVESIELTGLSCTDAEKQQLYTILRNGIQILGG